MPGAPYRSPGASPIAGHSAAPPIVWDQDALQPDLAPVIGDVLITLNRANIASIAYWTPDLVFPPLALNLRGAWVVKLCDIHTRPPSGVELSVGFPARFRCLWVFMWKGLEGVWGLQGSPDLWIPRLISLPEEPGLRHLAGRTTPSKHNIFVNFFTNNIPVATPMLQVEWWVPEFDRLPIPNSWVLGIWDCPRGEMAFTRTLSSWYGGRGAPWLQDGVNATCIFSRAASGDQHIRMELSPYCAPMEQPHVGAPVERFPSVARTNVWRVLPGELSRARAIVQPVPEETWAATQA